MQRKRHNWKITKNEDRMGRPTFYCPSCEAALLTEETEFKSQLDTLGCSGIAEYHLPNYITVMLQNASEWFVVDYCPSVTRGLELASAWCRKLPQDQIKVIYTETGKDVLQTG